MIRTMKRICIRQHHISDCGAACLASASAWFGLRFPLEQIRQWSGTQTHGISVQGIREGARALGLKAGAYRRTGSSDSAGDNLFRNLPVPSVFHMIKENGHSHFVVFYGPCKSFFRKKARYSIMDPEDGRIHRKTLEEILKQWTGVLVTLSKDENFKKGSYIPGFFYRTRVLMKGEKHRFAGALAASLLYTLTGIASALFLKQIADKVIPWGAEDFLRLLGFSMIYIALCAMALNMFRVRFLLKTGFSTASRLVGGFYRHILYLPQRFFDQRQSGELVARINDAFKVSTFLSTGLLNVALSAFTLFFSFVVMFLFNPKLSWICIAALPLYGAVYYLFDLRNKDTQRQIMISQANLETVLVDSLRGVAQIKYSTAQERMTEKVADRFKTYVGHAWRGGMNQLRAATGGDFITRGMGLAILWTGAVFVTRDLMSFGELLTFYALTAYFSSPVSEIITFSQKYRDARIAAERLFEIMELETEEDPFPKEASVSCNAGDLEIKDLSFHYPGRMPLFDNFSHTFHTGKITGIAGESGSGKSTMGALLMRMYTPDGGTILLDGKEAGSIPLSAWRRKIGIVPQKADLFEGNILDNIALGDPAPDTERVATLCSELGLEAFLSSLPRGILTPIGEQGVQLSGGQRQRIALARTAYRNPAWIILDEATSSLDSTSELYVLNALRKWSREGTGVIIIGHRMSTLSVASHILLLHQGRIAEEGSHTSLIKKNGKYAAWCRQQGL